MHMGCAHLNRTIGTVKGNAWTHGNEFLAIRYATAERFGPASLAPLPVGPQPYDATNILGDGHAACMQPPYTNLTSTYGVEDCLILNLCKTFHASVHVCICASVHLCACICARVHVCMCACVRIIPCIHVMHSCTRHHVPCTRHTPHATRHMPHATHHGSQLTPWFTAHAMVHISLTTCHRLVNHLLQACTPIDMHTYRHAHL